MAQSKRNLVFFRYILISCMLMVVCIAIVWNMVRISLIESEYWDLKADSLKVPNVPKYALRGNILSSKDEILASTVPEFRLFIDFRVEGLKVDTFEKYVVPLSEALAEKFGEKSVAEYERSLRLAYKKKKSRFPVCRGRVSYLDYIEVSKFPLLCKGSNKSGFFSERITTRTNPFGTIAGRTIGHLADTGGTYGLEQAYNRYLKGVDGVADREKVRDSWVDRYTRKPVNGMDIRTTLDLRIQTIAERALVEKLQAIEAETGSVVVMEVATGKVRAIANYTRKWDGTYYERRNNAVSDMVEPGSTFKTVAVMAALDDGVATLDEIFDTGNGIYHVGRSVMRDHNYNHGGYGEITLAQAIQFSSNIGTAKAILKGYEKRPAFFVEHVYRMGLADSVDFRLKGQGYPFIPHPDTYRGWNMTTLPWMSFGYNVQIPPIYILMFYNAIANGGKMIAPIFVTDALKDGKVVEHFEAEVVRDSICRASTLAAVRRMLSDVVLKGTAKMLQSPYVPIAGKTGTAQIRDKGQVVGHRVSFCGYFPDNGHPKYSCIVVITKPRIGYPSGGDMSGMVLRKIAERMYALGYFGEPALPGRDTVNCFFPVVKGGASESVAQACDSFGIKFNEDDLYLSKWVSARQTDEGVEFDNVEIRDGILPSVKGMGLVDALYIMESIGLNVSVNGCGTVYEQIPDAGTAVSVGQRVVLNLH